MAGTLFGQRDRSGSKSELVILRKPTILRGPKRARRSGTLSPELTHYVEQRIRQL